MKKTATVLAVILLTVSNLFSTPAYDFNIVSTDGYSVDIQIRVVEVIAPNTCEYGYNYNFRLEYDIAYSGENIPNSMWTLQTNVVHSNNEKAFGSIPVDAKNSGTITTVSNTWTSSTDCKTVTVEQLNITSVELIIQGSGISSRTITSNGSALPIVLKSFTAMSDNNNIHIDWSTYAEKNNDFFTLERSFDGKNFHKIATIDGAANSSSILNYSYIDNTPESVIYYMLSQTDFNGDTETFNIIRVSKTATQDIKIYPNPFTDNIFVSNAVSRIVVQNTSGSTVYESETVSNINLSHLSNGMYLVTVYDITDTATTVKMLKK